MTITTKMKMGKSCLEIIWKMITARFHIWIAMMWISSTRKCTATSPRRIVQLQRLRCVGGIVLKGFTVTIESCSTSVVTTKMTYQEPKGVPQKKQPKVRWRTLK